MIERLLEKKGNCIPREIVVELTKELKKREMGISIAEIGSDIGATSVELIKVLEEKDTYYIFDFERKVKELHADLKDLNSNNTEIVSIGNTGKRGDSYSYNLAKLMLQWRESGKKFDLVFLDGAHTFMHDGVAVCILKEMLSEGGYLILDDINWSLKKSPTCNPDVNPAIRNDYTDEQIECCQVGMVEECFLKLDSTFEKTEHSTDGVAVYKKRHMHI